MMFEKKNFENTQGLLADGGDSVRIVVSVTTRPCRTPHTDKFK